MSRVHWFNPENDLALASGAANYTPKRAAMQLRSAGSILPLWYADADDSVLCYGVNAEWFDRVRSDFGIGADIFDHDPLSGCVPDPWGWSAYTRHFFVDEGFGSDVLPSAADIDCIRSLSHRRTAAEVSRMLHSRLPGLQLQPPAVEICSVEEAERWLAVHPRAYIKFPWSSSGRGVFDVASAPMPNIFKLVDDSIRRQGSVMVEVAYDRLIDFARLYECRGGECLTVGTSVFHTDEHDSYTGNILGSEEYLLSLIAPYYDLAVLDEVFEALRQTLQSVIAPYYEGILGVDMFIAGDGTLAPVVEINLRKTMGYVARRFSDLYLCPDVHGVFQVVPTRLYDGAPGYKVDKQRLAQGTLLLTPDNPDFTFAVTV